MFSHRGRGNYICIFKTTYAYYHFLFKLHIRITLIIFVFKWKKKKQQKPLRIAIGMEENSHCAAYMSNVCLKGQLDTPRQNK